MRELHIEQDILRALVELFNERLNTDGNPKAYQIYAGTGYEDMPMVKIAKDLKLVAVAYVDESIALSITLVFAERMTSDRAMNFSFARKGLDYIVDKFVKRIFQFENEAREKEQRRKQLWG